MQSEAPSYHIGLAAAATAAVAWSIGNVLVRVIPMSGISLAFWRMGVAGAVYLAILYAIGRRLS